VSFTVLIPARLASSRLPNKPLADLGGIPMIVRVAQRVASLTSLLEGIQVVVATDSQTIVSTCESHEIQALLTRREHASGSDRLAEACEILNLDDDAIVVNVQGDEPLINPALVPAVADLLQQCPHASMSTAAHPIDSKEEFLSPNVVKVVTDIRGMAMYFSRAPIPHHREKSELSSILPLRHIGIYAYRVGFLKLFPNLSYAPTEKQESLEQLRALWHGYKIAVHITTEDPGPGVDTPEDLERVKAYFSK